MAGCVVSGRYAVSLWGQQKSHNGVSQRSFDMLSRIKVRPLPVCFIPILGFMPKIESITSLRLLAHGLEDRLQRSQFSCGDMHWN